MIKNENKFTGIILAGGKSSRMGKNKALMLLNGKRIIEYVYEMFDSFCDEIIISTNSPEEYNFLPARKQKDFYSNIGPIAGLHAGLKTSGNEINFICSCDTPFLTKELFLYLHRNSANKDIVTPSHNGITEPIIGLFKKKTYLNFEKAIEKKLYSPPKVEKTTNRLILEISKHKTIFNDKLFTNINTVKDFLMLKG